MRYSWRRPLAVLVCAAVLPLLSGCWDRIELEQLAFITVMGLDQGPHGQLLVTFKIARPAGVAAGNPMAAGGGGGGASTKSTITTTVVAPNIQSAETVASSYVGRRLTLVQNAAVLFGLPLAKKGLVPYLDALVRLRESRRTQLMLICSPSAQAVIDASHPPLETNPTAFLANIRELRQTAGWVPHLSLQSFVSGLESTSADPVAGFNALQPGSGSKGTPSATLPGLQPPLHATGNRLPRTGNGPTNVFGAVAFRGGKAVGVLSGQQTVVLNMLRGDYRRSVLTIPDPLVAGATDNLLLTSNRHPTVQVNTRHRVPSIRVMVPLEGSLGTEQSTAAYALRHGRAHILERAADHLLQGQALDLIHTAQRSWRADIFGFGQAARRNFATDAALRAYDWADAFPQAAVRVRFHVTIVHFGPLLGPPVKARA